MRYRHFDSRQEHRILLHTLRKKHLEVIRDVYGAMLVSVHVYQRQYARLLHLCVHFNLDLLEY